MRYSVKMGYQSFVNYRVYQMHLMLNFYLDRLLDLQLRMEMTRTLILLGGMWIGYIDYSVLRHLLYLLYQWYVLNPIIDLLLNMV